VRGDIEDVLEQIVCNGYIGCPECGNCIEPDAAECICGWENPAISLGLI